MDKLYVTANIVAHNSSNRSNNIETSTEQVIISDVFDIPDIMANPVAPELSSNNLVNTMNHITMTDLMTQNQLRNVSKQPSVSTKMSDVSIAVPAAVPAAVAVPLAVPAAVPVPGMITKIPNALSHTPTSLLVVPNHETNVKTNHKPVSQTHGHRKMTTKVIIEDEDKDTAIDYDDDDPEIKKIKLSLFHFAKDITFNLIFTIPFLRTKLNSILKEPNLAINQIEQVFDEFKDLLNRQQLENLKKYVCEDGIRDKLNYILGSGFNKILSDGKIDINDAPQFNQLVYFIIKSFNNINQGKVYRFYVSKDQVMILLHFILKSVFTLTLKGQEEQMAIGLLDTSFKLVQLEVLPLVSKRWYHRFRICNSMKEIEELIE